MTDTMMGHNVNPNIARDVTDRLATDYAHLAQRMTSLIDDATDLPSAVADKATNDRYADLIALFRGAIKDIDAVRVAEKDPHLKSERAIDGYFGNAARPDPTGSGLIDRLAAMQATLSERSTVYLRRIAAEERRRREEEARLERENAEALRRQEAEAARMAEEARRRDYAAKHQEKAITAAFEASLAESRADIAESAAQAKPADLARQRSTTGTLSTLKSEWVGKIEDIEAVPLEKLRPYISTDAIEKAVKAFVKNGGRQLPGVRIYETEKGMYR